MSDEDRPTPPAGVAQYVIDGLNRQNASNLRSLSEYAARLADWKESTAGATIEAAEDVEQARIDDDRPDGVPGKASTVVKEINDNRYYYWQWRDGDKIRSKYKGPVEP
ncbi:hypothetical protein [Haloarchaeobius amylolyticus]|uniref:hypothetical protein n=1 Tax=Haloarchaeobius amylolyticus TaxID=1198296 RepID=UPI00226E7E5B|nr:hypothetical protein [Haloarchaeobius amylolyticus]